MKKLTLCLILLFLSWKSFSQNDTIVKLQVPIAKLVVTDLLKGDAAKLELLAYRDLVKKLELTNSTQTELSLNLQTQIKNLNAIIDSKANQSELREKAISDLEDEIKRINRQKKLYKIGSAIGAAAILLSLVQ